MSLQCNSKPAVGSWRRTLCSVSHPIFHPGAEVGGVSPASPRPPHPSGALGFGVTRGCPVPQVVFTVTLDVPHGAELGDALEVVANASR